MENKISIVVVHRILDIDLMNLSNENWRRLKEFTYYPYELVYVDNDSLVQYSAGLMSKCSTYVRNNFNAGNGRAWDQGVEVSNTDTIIIMDNDCWPLVSNWDKEMIDKLSEPNVGITFPSCITGDAFDKMESGLEVEFYPRRDGFCFAFKKEIYKKVEPFLVDQPFKLGYYEDDNFEANVQYGLGMDLIGCDSSRVWHKGQATSKKMWSEEFAKGVKDNEKWYNNKWKSKYPYLKNGKY